ncbi:MAG: 30S ribosomal protein S17 [Candidatus Omnitrophica bacterium]|jgi:small subunit ribosomal protein S17|nr:30S ribosomal protein S17 [Candidatus Omnitrophota bacterium]
MDKKNSRSIKIEKTGVVSSDKMNKTRVVVVERLSRHPLYKKIIRKKNKFYVHDEGNISKVGDMVKIQQIRPLSKMKRWKLIDIIKKGQVK